MTSVAPERIPVLVVDDDTHLLRTLGDILRLRGYEPLTAGNAQAGLRLAEDHVPDLAVALVDLRLPDMDGIELVSRLHHLSQLTEVIILTGHASVDSAVAALRNGSIDYLVKPVKPDSLFQALRSATDRWHRRVAEQRLVETEERFRVVVENITDVILLIDQEGSIRYASPSVRRVLDIDPRDLLGARLVDRVHPEDRAGLERLLMGRLPNPMRPWEHRLLHRDGSWKAVESSVSDLLERPDLGSVAVVSRDIEDRKRLEAQLLHAQKMESVGRLAGGVAHDLNNLLTVITGTTSLALIDLTPDAEIESLMGEVLRACERAADLTRQLLAFSRQQILQPRVLDVNELVQRTEKLLGRVIGEDIEIRTHLAKDLWPVRADPAQLEQVLLNLAINARDAMPDGGRLTLRTAFVQHSADESGQPGVQGDGVLVEVRDTGNGIPPEIREQIFEPFFTTKEVGKGTGLGLATVHGIVEQSGGRIDVWSRVGEGATFQVVLPRADQAVELVESPEREPAGPAGDERILVVEDDPYVRALVARTLVRHGYRVFEAESAEDALAKLPELEHVDLLLTDVLLPGEDGVALAERVTGDRPEIRVLLTSGHAQAQAGGHPWSDPSTILKKPYTPDELLRHVRGVMDR